jgi:hypothetical protein
VREKTHSHLLILDDALTKKEKKEEGQNNKNGQHREGKKGIGCVS